MLRTRTGCRVAAVAAQVHCAGQAGFGAGAGARHGQGYAEGTGTDSFRLLVLSAGHAEGATASVIFSDSLLGRARGAAAVQRPVRSSADRLTPARAANVRSSG